MKHGRWFLAVPVLTLALVGMGSDWDSSVRIADGETHDARISSLNGPIRIGDSAKTGDCKSVNGSIMVGMNSQVGDISAVNGTVEIGAGSVVDGSVSTVNGRIALEDDVRAEAVSSVNGKITLMGAEITGDLSTLNGDVRLDDGASVGGDVIVEDRGRGSDRRRRPLRIELSGDSVIHGNVIVEDDNTEVELILSGNSRVEGKVEGAEIIQN